MNRLPSRDVVLVGAGHTNLHVVRMWCAQPLEDVRLTLISPFSRAAYSGMLPGTLAGIYAPHEMEIDLYQLAATCGARLVVDAAVGLDPAARRVICANRPPVHFDVASVGVGSVPGFDELWRGKAGVVAIKPMVTFRERLLALLGATLEAKARFARAFHRQIDHPGPPGHAVPGAADCEGPAGLPTGRAARRGSAAPLQVAVVGGGAGGVEIALAVDTLLSARADVASFGHRLTIIESSPEILSGYASGTIRQVRRECARRGVVVMAGARVVGITAVAADGASAPPAGPCRLEFAEAGALHADLVVWATAAAPPRELAGFDLPKTSEGFLAVRSTLQTTAGLPVFGVGDSATIVDQPIPKAGVHAVRQGPVLWRNIRRMLSGRPLLPYRPQKGFLSILSTGNGRAIAHYKGLTGSGRWAWHWKNHIDRHFMRLHQAALNGAPMTAGGLPRRGNEPRAAAAGAGSQQGMRCDGCAAKIDPRVLNAGLDRLGPAADPRVVCGLAPRDDAVVIDRRAAPVDVFTVDFFPAFLDDPYLVGRVAALNALSDIWATGAHPAGALAAVTLPPGSADQQAELLFQVLAGAARELHAAGAALWGGHTVEGPELTVGFSVAGQLDGLPPFTKQALRPGDCLLLTRPLGTGVLLAALKLGLCRAAWIDRMINTMLVSNARAAAAAREFGVCAATDVTGFGLAGHLREMLAPRGLAARLNLGQIPLLDGFAELAALEVRSSLDAANRAAAAPLVVQNESLRGLPQYAALFDPQTSGGLLLAVEPSRAGACAATISEACGIPAVVIGQVVEASETRIELCA